MFATYRFFRPEIEKTKQFVKKHQIPIACAATAVTTFIVFNTVSNGSEKFYEGMYNSLRKYREMDELEHLTLHEFIDYKDLRHEFERFNIQQNNL